MIGDYGDTSYEDTHHGQARVSYASVHEVFESLWARGLDLSTQIQDAYTWLGAHTSVSLNRALTQKMAAIESAPMLYGQMWDRTNALQDLVEEFE